MINTTRSSRLALVAGLAVAVLALAVPVSALAPAVEDAPAPAIPEGAQRVVAEPIAQDPAAPIVEPGNEAEIMAPPPDNTLPTIAPDTPGPKLDAAGFGVGWPAAAAVAVALAAVLIMALTWRRDESW